jgi:hypothetical protein
VHPSIAHSKENIAFVKSRIAAGEAPFTQKPALKVRCRSSIAGTRFRQDRELSVSPPVRRLGDLDDQNKKAKDPDLKCGVRLLSLYDTEAGSLCVITERDRSTTNVLLRTEY